VSQHGGKMKHCFELVRGKDRSHGPFIANVPLHAGERGVPRGVRDQVYADNFGAPGQKFVLEDAAKETRPPGYQKLRHRLSRFSSCVESVLRPEGGPALSPSSYHCAIKLNRIIELKGVHRNLNHSLLS
jgi:hypothetical protein